MQAPEWPAALKTGPLNANARLAYPTPYSMSPFSGEI